MIIYLKRKIVAAMDKLLMLIYDKFIEVLKDLQVGHMLTENTTCEIWEMMNAYELLDSNTLSLKERKQILDYYD